MIVANDQYPRLTRLIWQRHFRYSVVTPTNDNPCSDPVPA